VRLEVFDVAGRLVAAPHAGVLAAGEHRIPWDGVEGSGRRLPAGVYLYRAVTGSGVSETRKLVLTR
jgi:flagellar hook assembly protein FlgD